MAVRPVFLVLLGLAGLGILIERLVVTDAEAIEALVGDAESAFNEKRWEAFGQILVDDFEYGGRDRQATIEYLQRMAKKLQAEGVVAIPQEPVIQGDEATVQVRVRMRVMEQLGVVPVSLGFVRTDEGWRVKRASLGYGMK